MSVLAHLRTSLRQKAIVLRRDDVSLGPSGAALAINRWMVALLSPAARDRHRDELLDELYDLVDRRASWRQQVACAICQLGQVPRLRVAARAIQASTNSARGTKSLRLRLDPQYLPLVLRAVLLLLCAVVTSVLPGSGAKVAMMPTLMLLMGAALASIPVGSGPVKQMQVLTETLGAGFVVGALHGRADLFIAYLFVPLVVAGLSGGLALGLTAVGVASAALVLSTSLSDVGIDASSQLAPVVWVPMLLAITLVAAWIRRVIGPVETSTDAAGGTETCGE